MQWWPHWWLLSPRCTQQLPATAKARAGIIWLPLLAAPLAVGLVGFHLLGIGGVSGGAGLASDSVARLGAEDWPLLLEAPDDDPTSLDGDAAPLALALLVGG